MKQKMPPDDFELGPDLILDLRARFTRKGTSFSKQAKKLGVHPGNARHALLGGWTGPRAMEVVDALVRAAYEEAA